MAERIAFTKPYLSGKELHYVAQAMAAGKLSGDGEFTKRCQSLMETRFRARRVRLTTSCSMALEMAALLSKSKGGEGDEVIIPGFTFVSTANAFVLHGFRPVFVDIREDTLNLDERLLERAITPRTRVIVPVHYAGVACEMDTILEIARRCGALVVEDAAQGVTAQYKGRYLGTLGDLGCYSFHDTKNIVSGEGGALVINREDMEERADIIREKGTNRAQFYRGLVDKYTWVDVGSSYLPSDLLSAFLLAQLEAMDLIQAKRKTIWNRYHEGLADLARRGCFRAPVVPENVSANAHIYQLVTESLDVRTRLIQWLDQRSISAVFHYVPLHLSPMGSRFGKGPGSLPVVEATADRLLRLPLHSGMTVEDADRVIEAVHDFFARR